VECDALGLVERVADDRLAERVLDRGIDVLRVVEELLRKIRRRRNAARVAEDVPVDLLAADLIERNEMMMAAQLALRQEGGGRFLVFDNDVV
jgi:hypothetical protein